MKLADNNELREYLISLGNSVKNRGLPELAEVLLKTSNMAWVWPATEFLGESRIALRRVLAEHARLSNSEVTEIREILAQLDNAFTNRA